MPINDELRERILATNERFASEGQRVLGVAVRLWDDPELPVVTEDLEGDAIFIGMVAMMDPPRPEVEAAVLTAREAGIRPIMITGDHPLTALRIAQDLHIADNDAFVSGRDLANMSPEELTVVVDDVSSTHG